MQLFCLRSLFPLLFPFSTRKQLTPRWLCTRHSLHDTPPASALRPHSSPHQSVTLASCSHAQSPTPQLPSLAPAQLRSWDPLTSDATRPHWPCLLGFHPLQPSCCRGAPALQGGLLGHGLCDEQTSKILWNRRRLVARIWEWGMVWKCTGSVLL